MSNAVLKSAEAPVVTYSEAIDFSVPFPTEAVVIANDAGKAKRPNILARRSARWARREVR